MPGKQSVAARRLGAKALAVLLAAPAPAAATELDLGPLDWARNREALVAVLFDGPVPDPESRPVAVERIAVAQADEADARKRKAPQAPADSGKPRLTLRFTDLEPGRYGIALYANDELGRLDLTGLGVPRVGPRTLEDGRRRPRFDHAIVRLEGNRINLNLKLSY